MKTIGQATVLGKGIVRVKVRAEGQDMVGDFDAYLDMATFIFHGWETERPIEELAEGESTAILASE